MNNNDANKLISAIVEGNTSEMGLFLGNGNKRYVEDFGEAIGLIKAKTNDPKRYEGTQIIYSPSLTAAIKKITNGKQ